MGTHSCEQCGSAHLRRSRRKHFWEYAILPLFLIRPYRCQQCHKRQYGIGFHRFRREVSFTLFTLVLIAASGAFVAGTIYLLFLFLARL